MNRTRQLPPLTEEQVQRFKSKVQVRGVDDCWLWQGGRFANGYGTVSFGDESYITSRVAYYIETGDDPNELLICHTCDTPLCCNPKHLFLGTSQDNNSDRENKGRGARIQGEDCAHAKLTNADVRRIRFLRSLEIPIKELARKFKVKPRTIRAILEGENWTHLKD